jgi:hypothetical protein
MTTDALTTQAKLDDRYGRRTSRRRRIVWWSIVGAIAVVAVGALGFSTVSRSIEEIDVTATGYNVADAHTTTVTFQITTPPGRVVACALEAQDEEHGIVGWRIVEYPASEEHSRAFTETIPTVALATTGLVNSCWVA